MQHQDTQAARAAALDAFRSQPPDHRNCAQSVLLYALRTLGDDEGAVEYGRYLGGGVGRCGLTCGALTGAALALAARDIHDLTAGVPPSDQGVAGLETIVCDFQERFGSTHCEGLTGCRLSTEAGMQRFRDEDIRERQCVVYVGWVCDRLAQTVEEPTASQTVSG